MKQNKGRSGNALLWGTVAIAGGVVLGRPLLAKPVAAAKQRIAYQMLAHAPLLDKAILRGDQALDLNLTNDQKTEIKPIIAEAFVQARQIHRNESLAPKLKRAAFKKLITTTREKLASILTTEQIRKLEAARAKFDLGLSDEQKAKIAPIVKEAAQQARAVHWGSLTDEQKQIKLVELHSATRAKAAAILTRVQREKALSCCDAEYLTNVLAKELGLTSTQKTGVQDILNNSIKQAQAVFATEGTTSEQKAARLREIRNNTKASLAEELTPDQQKKLAELHATLKATVAKLGHGRMAHAGFGGGWIG